MTEELKPCPFCGCKMKFNSNRDWHRVEGLHLPDCVFSDVEDAVMTVPATKNGKEWAITAWNRRAASADAGTTEPIRIVLPPMTETESDKQWHVLPQKIWHVEQSPDEKLVHDLVAAMKKIRNASDDLSAYYGGVDGRTELDKAISEADAVLAAVGAKDA